MILSFFLAAVSMQPINRMTLPASIDALKPLANVEIAAAPGEHESLALLLSEPARLSVTGVPREVTVDTRIATPYRRKLRDGEITQPFLLEEVSTVAPAGRTVYWLTFKVSPRARPGRYKLTVRAADASLDVPLVVRPFRLRRDPNFFFGAFCGAKDSDITPAHMRDLAERGFDALQFFWNGLSLPVRNEGGEMKVDFTFVNGWMRELTNAGMKGPVVWSLGNDSTSHTENMLSQVFGIPRPEPRMKNRRRWNFSDVNNPELNRRLKELMLSIKGNAAAQKWPELAFLIYDEPTERLMAEHENRYQFIKSFWPDLRIYGVTMNRISWAKSINHMVDILVANGDFEPIRELAEESGKPFWMYGSASARNEAELRHSHGWRTWAHRGQAAWFWAYNYHPGDPYDDFDGGSPDSGMAMVWPPRKPGGPLVWSVSWDGMREAVDDIAYIQTLEWMLGRSKSKRAADIRASLERMRAALPAGKAVRVVGGDAHDTVEQLDPHLFVSEGRRAVAGWIEELLVAESNLYREIRAE
jgi:hypothetical protein